MFNERALVRSQAREQGRRLHDDGKLAEVDVRSLSNGDDGKLAEVDVRSLDREAVLQSLL